MATTITVLYEGKKQYKVRLQHIDCPETRQPFAAKAKQSLSSKVFGNISLADCNFQGQLDDALGFTAHRQHITILHQLRSADRLTVEQGFILCI